MSSLHRGHANLLCIIPTLVHVLLKWAAHILCYIAHILCIFRADRELCVCVQSLSCVQFFVTPSTIPHQASLSMEFSRQEYWIGLPFPIPRHLSDSGIKLALLHWHVDFLPLCHLWSFTKNCIKSQMSIIQSEVNQKEKNTHIWNLERWYWWTYFQGMKKRCRHKEHTYRHEGWGRKKRVEQMERITRKHINCVCMCAKSFHHAWHFATPWSVTHQTPLSMGFSRQEYWSGL